MTVNAPIDDFVALVREFPLRKIKTKKENRQAIDFFRKVRSVGEDNLSQCEILSGYLSAFT